MASSNAALDPPGKLRGRPVSKYGPKAFVPQFKYRTVDYRHRLDVINRVADIGMSAFLDSYCVNYSTTQRETTRKKVYGWIKRKGHIEQHATLARTAHQKCARKRGTGTTLPLDAEEQLARWVLGMRKDGIPVTYAMLRMMALETAIDVGLSEDEFRAGWHWIHGFKKRHVLTFYAKTRIGQDSNEDGAAMLADFSERVLLSAMANDVETIYNADQTAVNYEYLPTKTLNPTKENTVWVKCAGRTKERATAMLLGDTDGNKHPLFLVLKTTKSKKKEVVQENLTMRHGFGRTEVEPLQSEFGCEIYGNPTAWWNAGISLAFLKYHFGDRPDRETKKIMLLWDDFSAQFTEEVVAYAESINVVLERIPPRFTWVCQPADVAWIRPLKSALRENWLVEIRRQVRNSRLANVNLKLRGPSRSTMVSWITVAWTDLPSTVILNGFRTSRLLPSAVEECVVVDSVVDANVLVDLVANLAIEETIDPASDIDVTDVIDHDEVV
ncbi:hypothetical protein DYB31_014031 [Aphanomyces astaci]|uniref:HTH CENPB-type domain-containing protein n=2 Tax=Aphanomyces astaci TaxID=112090 RepID=A0A397ECS6_APHAT|nr:hypothetical protein DYB31_014031 [Aphanomyces astaci]